MIAPVLGATVERSNSSLRFVKSGFSSTMREDRLNALLLLFVHKDIALDYDAIIDDYQQGSKLTVVRLSWTTKITMGQPNCAEWLLLGQPYLPWH